MAVREKKEKTTGKKAKGKKPAEPKPGSGDTDRVNFTDEESRIMPVSRNKEASYSMESDCGQTADNSMERMKAELKTHEGRAEYGKRKGVVEPVFGIIKEVLKFRRFLLRGLKKAKGEWTWACMAYNVKRMRIIRTSQKEKRPVRCEFTHRSVENDAFVSGRLEIRSRWSL